jgi:Uma2 family endonuclease
LAVRHADTIGLGSLRKADVMSTVEQKVLPLYPGQRLKRDEFLRRWEALPELKFAELIGGMVYMSSPVSADHGDVDVNLGGWVAVYAASTPVCRANSNSTWLMLGDLPQPDDSLRILTELGGHSRREGRYYAGAPELIGEVSLSSECYDLHEKLNLYQAAGVDEYLAVLLASREVRWHRLVSGVYEVMPPSPDGVFRSQVFPGLWLHPAALLEGDMPHVLATLQQGLQSPEHAAFVRRLQLRNGPTAT